MTKTRNRILWVVQIVLTLLFLFAGSMKLILPIAVLTQQTPLPGWFVRFLGVAEVSGALALILPGLFRIRQGLTPLAAALLSIIMVGATVITLTTGGGILALMPFLVGVLTASLAYNRSEIAIPSRRKSCLAQQPS
jgi:uncharacterized membrane protein YphA (DoxX/SURF4 family)